MVHFYGLYFGASNICLAIHKDGKTEVLANAAGDRVTPAVVAFVNGEKSIGLPAKQGMYRNANNTVTQVKQLICGNEDCIENEVQRSKCKIIQGEELKYEIEQDGAKKRYTPFEILVLLFQNVKEIAKSHSHNEESYPTVVTVPLNISPEQKNTIKEAATRAGFHLLRIISESSAAALAYSIGQDNANSSGNCVIYRMGGTSLDVTVIRVINGMYNILSFIHRGSFGGSTFTNALVDHCVQEFQRQYKADIRENKRSVMKLQIAAENCKHVLSTLRESQCFAESVYDGIDLSIQITRARFESLICNTLIQSLDPIQEALKESGLEKKDISKIIFAGGSCRIPKLQQLLFEMFPSATHLYSISPDEVIAIGAAKQASLISESSDHEVLGGCFVELLSRSIYLKVLNNSGSLLFFKLFDAGSTIPAHFSQMFVLPEDQTSFCLELYENSDGCNDDLIDPQNGTLLAKVSGTDLLGKKIALEIVVESVFSIRVTYTDVEFDNTVCSLVQYCEENKHILQQNGQKHIDLN